MGWFCLKGFSHEPKQPNESGNPADVLLRSLAAAVRFEEKPVSEQREILKYVSMNWKDLQQDSSVIAALAETSFVTGADGELYKPKDLFDPGDAILKSLFSAKIPGKRFVSSDRWLSILRKTGLQNMRDADTVLRCARRIEFLGAQSMKDDTEGRVSKEIWSLAETLIKTIFGNSADLLQDHSFCSAFGKIACVPAENGFPLETRMREQRVKRVVCSYSDAILLKDWPLAWTVAPIVSKDPPDYSWEALQLRSPPPFTLILKHLQPEGTISMLCYSTFEEATLHVLKYLDANWSSFSSSDVSKLSNLPLIPTPSGGLLTSPRHYFTHLTINLWPIAHELPLCYMPFVKILKEMGLHDDKLSISSAVVLLSRRRRYLLDPNELRAVIALLDFIYDEMQQQHKSDTSNWKSMLVVPDIDCRLVRPDSCSYIDPFGSQYLKYIDSSKLRLVHHDVPERVCLAFGIRKLSDIVVEQVDRVEHLQTLEEIGSVSLAAIRLKLLSRSFQAAVSSVVASITTSGFKNPDFLTLQRSLVSVAERLQFVRSIYTRFWLLPDSLDITLASTDFTIPEWETESSHRALYYVDRSYTCMLIAEPPSYVPVLDLVAIVVSHVLGSPVPLPIGSLFLCPQDSETEPVNILKLPSEEREMGRVLIGGDIVPQDALQVQHKPLRPFYKGEIVAWKSQNGDILKYGRIVEDERPSTGQTLYKQHFISLETSPWKIETVISSRVFCFGSSSMACKSSTHRHAIKELEHGRVPANKFVQAVKRMLSVAGINLDSDKQHLHQKYTLFLLQGRLNESQVLEQEKSQIAREEVHIAETALLCRICLTSETNVTVVPCGHALCRQCSCHLSRCPFCRVQVYSYQNIHRY